MCSEQTITGTTQIRHLKDMSTARRTEFVICDMNYIFVVLFTDHKHIQLRGQVFFLHLFLIQKVPVLKSQPGDRLCGLSIFVFFVRSFPAHHRSCALNFATTEFIPIFIIQRQSYSSTLSSGWCWRTMLLMNIGHYTFSHSAQAPVFCFKSATWLFKSHTSQRLLVTCPSMEGALAD
jgi:hypothetical protein